MQKNKVKILLALALTFLIVNSAPKYNVLATTTTQENNTVSYGILAEGIDILYGENGAVGVVVNVAGGNMTIGFDTSNSAFNRLEFMLLSFGKGTDWTRYLHKPLWQVPPGVLLTLSYRVGFGFTEDDAIDNAFAAAKLIGNAYGLEFHVMWEELANNIVTVVFYALMDEEGFDDFFEDTFMDIIGRDGFGGFLTVDAMVAAPYARLLIGLLKDMHDGDHDGNTNEFVPVASAAYIAEDAIVDVGNGYYELSLNHIFMRTGNITWHENSTFSIITVKIPFPVMLDKTASTPTNSSYPAMTGKYTYLLHIWDKESDWEYSWPSELDDIVIKFKPYNYTELETDFPVIKAQFRAEPYPQAGGAQSLIDLILDVKNEGTDTAMKVRAIIPLDEDTYNVFHQWEIWGILELFGGWELKAIVTPEGNKYALVAYIGDLAPSDSWTGTIRFHLDWTSDEFSGIIPFVVGPVVTYTDKYDIRYSILANGIIYPFNNKDNNGTFIIPQVRIETEDDTSYVEIGSTVDVVVNVSNYGGIPAEDINITVIHAITNEYGDIMEMESIDFYHLDFLNESYHNPLSEASAEFSTTYKVRARPGMHFVGAIISYRGWYVSNTTPYTVTEFNATVISNLVAMFVLPPYRTRGNIFRYPLPHAEILVDKTIEVDNETGIVTVRLNLTNVGDINTTIAHIIDYWNSTQVEFIGNVKVDGTSFAYAGAVTNEKIDTMYVVIANKDHPITLNVNESIIVEYQLNITLRGETFELLSNPTIVLYDFGPYEMVEEEEPMEGEGEGGEGALFYASSVKALQESATSQFVQTFTEALIQVVSTVAPPPSEEEQPPPSPKIPGGIILLAGIALAVIVIGALLIRRRK